MNDQPRGRIVEAGDYRLHVIEVGSGTPLLMLHGAGPGATGWNRSQQNVPALAEHFRLLIVDLPGFGGSQPAPDGRGTGPYAWAEAIAELLRALQLEKVHVVGNANGANAAMWLGIDHPELVDRMVLTAPFVGSLRELHGGATEGLQALEAARAALRQAPAPESMAAYLHTLLFHDDLVTDSLVADRLRQLKSQALGAPTDTHPCAATLSDRLGSLGAPTLILFGHDDRHVPVKAANQLLDSMPDAELHVFQHCGHWVDLDRAADFERLTIGFLR